MGTLLHTLANSFSPCLKSFLALCPTRFALCVLPFYIEPGLPRPEPNLSKSWKIIKNYATYATTSPNGPSSFFEEALWVRTTKRDSRPALPRTPPPPPRPIQSLIPKTKIKSEVASPILSLLFLLTSTKLLFLKGLLLSGESFACFPGLTRRSVRRPLVELGRRSWENNNSNFKRPEP